MSANSDNKKEHDEHAKLTGAHQPSLPICHSPDQSPKPDSKLMTSAAYGAIFLVALIARLCFGLFGEQSQIVFSCDASEYLRDARGISELLTELQTNNSGLLGSALGILTGSAEQAEAARVREALQCVGELKQAGPVFPLFLFFSYYLAGKAIEPGLWQIPVISQAIVTSLTCLLITHIAGKAWNRKAGFIAGVIAALYPSFIINSARMYSESFSAMLLCLAVVLALPLLNEGYASKKYHPLASGIVLSLLQLSRSVMVMVTLLLAALSFLPPVGKDKPRMDNFFQRPVLRPILINLSWLILGIFIIMAPWMTFQQIAFGKSSFLVDRVGNYNLFVGTRAEIQGFLSYPYPDGHGIEKRSMLSLIGEAQASSPARFLRLMLDKPPRLIKFPWNDFRTPLSEKPFPISYFDQVIYHQLVLLFALAGLLITIRDFGRPESDWQETEKASAGAGRLRLLILSLVAMHAIYLLFITVPRYNLTLMPMLIMLAGAGAHFIFKKALDKSSRKLALLAISFIIPVLYLANYQDLTGMLFAIASNNQQAALILECLGRAVVILLYAITLSMLVFQGISWSRTRYRYAAMGSALLLLNTTFFYAAPLRAHGRWHEWKAPLGNSPVIRQSIGLPEDFADRLGRSTAYLLIDCQDWQTLGADSSLKVNGRLVNGPIMPLTPFLQNLDDMKQFGKRHYLECEYIFDAMARASKTTNIALRQWFAVPVPSDILEQAAISGPGRLLVEIEPKSARGDYTCIFGSYWNHGSDLRLPSLDSISWEKAFLGVENPRGFSDARYDTKLRMGSSIIEPENCAADLSTAPGLQTGQFNIRLLLAPGFRKDKLEDCQPALFEDIEAIKPIKSNARIEVTGELLPSYSKTSVWLADIRFSVVGAATDEKAKKPEDRFSDLALSFKMEARSQDSNGSESIYISPWLPDSCRIESGRNSFAFALPLMPAALPGELRSLALSCELQDSSASIDNFSLEIHEINAPLITPGIEVL